jgi:hypothetical protein
VGLFGAVSSTWSKAQAAAIIQGLLERQVTHGLLELSPLAVSNHLVANAWAINPGMFEGKTGPKPHKAAVAAFALAFGILAERREGTEDMQNAYTIALGVLIEELRARAEVYPFHHVDHKLLEKASGVLSEEVETMRRAADIFV